MKKFVSIMLISLSLFGSLCLASTDLAQINTNEGIRLVPLHGDCDQVPMPTNGGMTCNPDNEGCPPWTEPVAKYCWGGWGTGFYRCGFACHKVADGGHNNDRGGHGGHKGDHGGHGDHGGRD
ncbi:hypothetical protein [Bdellovibrio sp. BCCA]|uniref:hypothetical protein n=1 Tax=Bdellovibrio sp. BCCA TaxID=3136281 RepID=UPI0030EFBCAC